MNRSRILKSALVGTVAAVALAGAAFGQARSFDVPAGDLKAALDAYIRQAGVQLIYRPDDVRGKSTRGVHGAFAPEAALEQLLAGSDVIATRAPSGAIVVAKPPQGEAGAPPASEASQLSENTQLAEILVTTGSRIRGAPPSSPVIRLSQADMRNAGNANLGDAIRQLPQNFSGGSSPAIGQGATGSSNANSSFAINLRGIGPDATLTLLNGRRLAYNGTRQGVDITAIPLEAVDRLEIVADGASALYGSDAVAGVANVILRRDFDGLSATARFGTATDGGDAQQQYSLVGGHTWSSGGLITTLNYEKSTEITARQRSYARAQDDTTILYPPIESWGAVISGHQRISSTIDLNIDALYNDRSTFSATPLTATGSYLQNGSGFDADDRSYTIAPSLQISLPRGWEANASIVYGRDKTKQIGYRWSGGVATSAQPTEYDNETQVYEVTAEGPLGHLPGGDIRLAVGGGYRQVDLDVYRGPSGSTAASQISVGQDASYAFGELYLPFLANPQASGPARLALTAAARYENYPGMDKVFVPKFGVRYSLIPGVELRASWGKSFKAPVLNQQYAAETVNLYAATAVGAAGYPAGSTILSRTGGNPDLVPERATTWSATALFQPPSLPGAKVEASYFNIDYTDRVVAPMPSLGGTFTNPIYASLIQAHPTPDMVASVIAEADGPLSNASGTTYNPNNVIAIYDRRSRNAAEQHLSGVDIAASYDFDAGRYGGVFVSLSGTYLKSKQVLLPGQPALDLSGIIFNPPKVRARAAAVWSIGDLTLSPSALYTGSLADNRTATSLRIDDQVSFDLTVRYNIRTSLPGLHDLTLSASVLNVTNEAPESIVATAVYNTPYESTNYTPIGRFVGVSLTGRW